MRKCDCQTNGVCRHHSKVKMVVALKYYKYDLKVNGKLPVFYSYIKEDNKLSIDELIKKMISRLESKFSGHYNKLLFYDNQNQSNSTPLKIVVP